MIPILNNFNSREFATSIVSLWEGRALKWLQNYIATNKTQFYNMFSTSKSKAINSLCDYLYTDFTGYNINEKPRLDEKLSKIKLWDIQYIDEFVTKYFDLLLDLEENRTFLLTKIFDKLPYPWNIQIKQKYDILLQNRALVTQKTIEELHNLGDIKKSITETIQEACQKMTMQKRIQN